MDEKPLQERVNEVLANLTMLGLDRVRDVEDLLDNIEKIRRAFIQLEAAALPAYVSGYTIPIAKMEVQKPIQGFGIWFDPFYTGRTRTLILAHEGSHVLVGDVRGAPCDPDAILQQVRNSTKLSDLKGLVCGRHFGENEYEIETLALRLIQPFTSYRDTTFRRFSQPWRNLGDRT